MKLSLGYNGGMRSRTRGIPEYTVSLEELRTCLPHSLTDLTLSGMRSLQFPTGESELDRDLHALFFHTPLLECLALHAVRLAPFLESLIRGRQALPSLKRFVFYGLDVRQEEMEEHSLVFKKLLDSFAPRLSLSVQFWKGRYTEERLNKLESFCERVKQQGLTVNQSQVENFPGRPDGGICITWLISVTSEPAV